MKDRSSNNLVGPCLVGDIGGTNMRFALFDPQTAQLTQIKVFATQTAASLPAALGTYLASHPAAAPAHMALAAAGPKIAGRIALTNAAHITAEPKALCARFGLKSCLVTNDMTAYAAGLIKVAAPALPDFGRALVLTLGTGLGTATIVRQADTFFVQSSEGGNSLFLAPHSLPPLDLAALLPGGGRYLVMEDVISGTALPALHRALHGGAETAQSGRQILAQAQAGEAAATATLTYLGGALGAFCRNMLILMGGADTVFLGGGLGQGLFPLLAQTGFFRELNARGKSSLDLSRVQVLQSPSDEVALLGAGLLASGTISELGA